MFGLELIVDVVAVFVSSSFFTTQNFIVEVSYQSLVLYSIPVPAWSQYDNDVEMVQLINGACALSSSRFTEVRDHTLTYNKIENKVLERS